MRVENGRLLEYTYSLSYLSSITYRTSYQTNQSHIPLSQIIFLLVAEPTTVS